MTQDQILKAKLYLRDMDWSDIDAKKLTDIMKMY